MATVPGGGLNVALGTVSFAAGYRAKANHQGAFVWGDSTPADFASTGNNQFLIRASGGVGIGTNSPQAQLHASSNAAVGPFAVGQAVGRFVVTGADAELSFARRSLTAWPAAPAAGDRFVWYNPDGTARLWSEVDLLTVTGAGNVGVGTSTPTATFEIMAGGTTLADAWTTRSSARFKTNVQTIPSALGKVLGLRGVSFDWKDSGKRSVGFIAEEVGRVVPEAVEYEENGREARGLDYSKLTPVLVEAVREQQRQIEELRRRNAQLAREVRALKASPAHHSGRAAATDNARPRGRRARR